MGQFKIESCRVHIPGCMDLVYYDDRSEPLHEIIVDDEVLNQLKAVLLKNFPVSLDDFDTMDLIDHVEAAGYKEIR